MRFRAGASLAFLLVASSLHAEPSDAEIAAARASFQVGLELEMAGDFAAALDRFRGVAAVRMTPQVRFHLARCHDRLGHLVEALGIYRVALAEAEKTAGADEVMREATLGRDSVERRAPRLLLRLAPNVPTSARVSLDGHDVTLGVAQLVDPGGHDVTLVVPGRAPTTTRVTLAEGESRTVEVVAAELAPAPAVSAPAAPRREPGRSVVPWVVGGAGVVAAGAAGVFYALRGSTLTTLDRSCTADRCPASVQSDYDRGRTYTTLGNVALVVGVVGVGASITLFAVGGTDVVAGPGGGAIRGRF